MFWTKYTFLNCKLLCLIMVLKKKKKLYIGKQKQIGRACIGTFSSKKDQDQLQVIIDWVWVISKNLFHSISLLL